MSKRKPLDKTQARERRNQLLKSAAAAELTLTEGVREMRAIAGMTQEEFARHRGVSARVIKAIELGQGNPTVATLNRIGQFFGLEVAFVPVRRVALPEAQAQSTVEMTTAPPSTADVDKLPDLTRVIREMEEAMRAQLQKFAALNESIGKAGQDLAKSLREQTKGKPGPARRQEATRDRGKKNKPHTS